VQSATIPDQVSLIKIEEAEMDVALTGYNPHLTKSAREILMAGYELNRWLLSVYPITTRRSMAC